MARSRDYKGSSSGFQADVYESCMLIVQETSSLVDVRSYRNRNYDWLSTALLSNYISLRMSVDLPQLCLELIYLVYFELEADEILDNLR